MTTKLSELVKEFLLSEQVNARTINQKSKEYIDLLESQDNETNQIIEKLISKHTIVSNIKDGMEKMDVLPKLEKYIQKQNVFKLLNLAKSLTLLEEICLDRLEDVPDLIIQIAHDAPLIPNNSKMKAFLISTISKIRSQQLQLFHEKFEKHLQIEVETPVNTNVYNDDNNNTNSTTNHNPIDSWIHFLSDARQWLLSYSCINLLPVILTESKSLIQERYIESLDEALTPLWGRFHFHLSIAREKTITSSSSSNSNTSTITDNITTTTSNSSSVPDRYSSSSSSSSSSHHQNNSPQSFVDQIIWTFSYAKNFIDLVLGLCTEITISGKLERLHDISYRDIAKVYIVEKAIRFMRAHLADIIMQHTPMSNEYCLLLVEETFSIDDYFSNILIQSMYVCHVIYDAKHFHNQWLLIEYTKVMLLISNAIHSSKDIYALKFGVTANTTMTTNMTTSNTNTNYSNNSNNNNSNSNGNSNKRSNIMTNSTDYQEGYKNSNNNNYRCYEAVYNCMKIFILTSQRYQYLPAPSQDILSQLILEPILCLCIGIFLMRIKTDVTLFRLSNHHHHHSSSSSSSYLQSQSQSNSVYNNNNTTNSNNTNNNATYSTNTTTSTTTTNPIPVVIQDFIHSIHYFQNCLLHSANHSLRTQFMSERYENSWKRVHNWFPKRFITHREFTASSSSSSSSSYSGGSSSSSYSITQLFQFILNEFSVEEIIAMPSSSSSSSLSSSTTSTTTATTAIRGGGGGMNKKPPISSSSSGIGNVNNKVYQYNIGYVIETVRAQALTLSQFYEDVVSMEIPSSSSSSSS